MSSEPRVNDLLQGYHGDRRVVPLPENDSPYSGYAWQEKVSLPPDWEETDRQRVQDLFAQRVRVLQSRSFAHVAPLHKAVVEQGCLVVVEGHLDAKRDFNSNGTPRTLLDYLDEKRGLDPRKLVPVVRQLLLAYLELYEAGLPYYGAVQPQDVLCLGDWEDEATYPRIVLTGAAIRFVGFEGINPRESDKLVEGKNQPDRESDLHHLVNLICRLACGREQVGTITSREKLLEATNKVSVAPVRNVLRMLCKEKKMLSKEEMTNKLGTALKELDKPPRLWTPVLAAAVVAIVLGFWAGHRYCESVICDIIDCHGDSASENVLLAPPVQGGAFPLAQVRALHLGILQRGIAEKVRKLKEENERLRKDNERLKEENERLRRIIKETDIDDLLKEIKRLQEENAELRAKLGKDGQREESKAKKIFREWALAEKSMEEIKREVTRRNEKEREYLNKWIDRIERYNGTYKMTVFLPEVDKKKAKSPWTEWEIHVYVNGTSVLSEKCNEKSKDFPREVGFQWRPDQPIQILLEGDRWGGPDPNLIDKEFRGGLALWHMAYEGKVQSPDGVYTVRFKIEPQFEPKILKPIR